MFFLEFFVKSREFTVNIGISCELITDVSHYFIGYTNLDPHRKLCFYYDVFTVSFFQRSARKFQIDYKVEQSHQ